MSILKLWQINNQNRFAINPLPCWARGREVQPISGVALMHIGTQDQDGLNVWEFGMAIGIECQLVVITGVNKLAVIHARPLINNYRAKNVQERKQRERSYSLHHRQIDENKHTIFNKIIDWDASDHSM